jgi:hypothetical protein
MEEITVEDIDGIFIRSVEYGTIPLIIVGVYALSALFFICPVYFRFSMTATSPIFKFRFRMIGFSAFLFLISGAFDALNNDTDLSILAASRFILLISIVCLYLGYTPPRFIRDRYE